MTRSIVVLTTGGSIAERIVPDGAGTRMELAYRGRDLIAMAGDIKGVDIEVDDVFSVDGYALTIEQAIVLVARINVALDRHDVAGAIVTHGTDTIEETAFLSDLLVGSDKPVVFTGAMVAPSEPGTDVPRNLAAAMATVTSMEARGLGTVVIFNNEVHAARTVTKAHTETLHAFQSPGWGPLGTVYNGVLSLRRRPAAKRATFRVAALERRVELVRVALDSSPIPIMALADSGVAGLVIEAMGSGNVPPRLVPAIGHALGKGIAVVIASRVGAGAASPVTASPGCGRDLADLGAVFAGDLAGNKARLLLMVALSDPAARDRVDVAFAGSAG